MADKRKRPKQQAQDATDATRGDSKRKQAAPPPGPSQKTFVFYIAHAHIVEVLGPSTCKLWFLNHANTGQVVAWLETPPPVIPSGEVLAIDFNLTLDTSWTPEAGWRDVDVAPAWIGNLALTKLDADFPLGGPLCGQVAIEAKRWSELKQPPVDAGHAYRFSVTVIVNQGQVDAAYLGFRALVIGVAKNGSNKSHIAFFSTTDELLGDAWVDLDDKNDYYDDGKSGCLTGASPMYEEGPVFVSVKRLGNGSLYFLIGPKVPYGAGALDYSQNPTPTRSPQPIPTSTGVVCGAGSDTWLVAVRKHITDHKEAGTERDLEDHLVALLGTYPRDKAAILVSHSDSTNGAHALRFGGFTLNEHALLHAGPAFQKAIEGRRVYLVGCCTGLGSDAARTLASLEGRFGVTAFGTNRIVGLYDIANTGVRPRRFRRLFVRAGELGTKTTVNAAQLVTWLEDAGARRQPSLLRALLQRRASVKANVSRTISVSMMEELTREDTQYYLPGMLSTVIDVRTVPVPHAPDIELLFELLFGGWIVRVTPLDPRRLPQEGLFVLGRRVLSFPKSSRSESRA